MEVKRSKASRRLKYSSNYLALALTVLGILAVANFFFQRHFARIDLTQDKRYTLTASTKEILGGLDDIVTMKLYFSNKIPSYLLNLKRDVADLLDEYRAYAGGNITVTFIDPADDPALQQELRFMGIPQVQLNIIERDQAQLTNVYLGMAIFYEDKKEVIPFISDTRNLEYDLTSAVVKVTRKESKTVGVFTGSDHSLSGDYQGVKQLLEQQYTVQEVTLSAAGESLEQIDTLLVAGPRELTDLQIYAIDQLVMRGAKIIFLIDTVAVQEGLQATSLKPGTDELLQHYGIKVEENLVLDRAHASAAFRSGFMTFRLPYPYWVKVVQEGFSPDNPAVSNLESLVLPWTSSLTFIEERAPAVTLTELARSTPFSWLRTGFYSLDPQQRFMTPGTTTGSYPLVLSLSGRFTSFFAGKPVPALSVEAPSGNAASPGEAITQSPETQIIVVGNSRFVTNDMLTQFQDNQIFLMNIIDWLTLGEQLIGIRSRGATDRPLRETTEYAKSLIKFLNMFAIPLLLILFGLVRFYLRRRKKRSYAPGWQHHRAA